MGTAEQAVTAVVRGIVVTLALAALVPAAAWVESRVEARVRGRRGRRRPGPFGLLGPLADAVAVLSNAEPPAPGGDRPLRAWAPLVGFLPAALLFGVVALSSGYGLAPDLAEGETSLGLLAMLAAGAFLVQGAALAGPGSGLRGVTAGAVRVLTTHSGALVAWGLCLIAVAVVHGSARLSEIAWSQSRILGFAPAWNLWLQPLGFATYVVATLALGMRAPFGAARSCDLGGGLASAFTGPRLALLLGARHAFTLAAALAAAHLYLGGSHLPGTSVQGPVPTVAVVGAKALALVAFLSLVSASLPRLTGRRAAQVAWRLMVPAAGLNLALAGLLAAVID